MIKVLEAVPNFSEGRDLAKVRALVEAIAATGVEVLDWSADPDHHRSVVTFIGDPPLVEDAALAAARFALEHIDLNGHEGLHPRVGALDVLPFVPLEGLETADAVESAHRVGARIAELGVPVYFYGRASTPPGRGLAELRSGGFEALREGFPEGRGPDLAPDGVRAPHPTAGVTCVGARDVLLAWNVVLDRVELEDARRIASAVRESGGGFAGVRALGLELERRGVVQVSMNVEDVDLVPPLRVLAAIEEQVAALGGRIAQTEVIGMIPDALVHPAGQDRLDILDLDPARILSRRVAEHVRARLSRGVETPDDTT